MRAGSWLEEAQERERAGCMPEAIASYEAAIAAAERSNESTVLAESLRRLAVARHHRDERVEASRLCHRSYEVAQRSGDDHLAAEALNTRGGLELVAGRLDDARRTFLAALTLGASSRRLQARVEQNLGILANIQGDVDAATRHYERSLEAYRLGADLHGCAIAYNNLGLVSRHRGLLQAAERYFRDSYAIARHTRDIPLQILTLVNQAETDVARQQFQSAKQLVEAALDLCDRFGWQRPKADAYRVLGVIYRETGREERAEPELRTAIGIAAANGAVLEEAEATREMAVLYQALGRNREALRLLNTASHLFRDLDARGDLIDVGGRVAQLETTYLAVVRAWGESIESSNPHLFGQCTRVARGAVAMARAMALCEQQETTILLGAYLHDLGMVRVPPEIIHKPAPLSPAERTIMQMHPVWGVALLADVELPWDIQPIIRWHHERLDGSGYPDALKGDEIPLGAQIVGILNTYDAMITSRPHRARLSPSAAIAKITECRHWWSDRVFEAFRRTVQDARP